MTPEQMARLRNELVDVLIDHWDRVMASSTDPVKTDSLVLTVLLGAEDADEGEVYLSIKLEEVQD